jgi:hypothetical protein
MMASRRNGTLYVRVTNHLAARAFRTGVGSQFTAKYAVKMLVWYEHYGHANDAIAREKAAKEMGAALDARTDRAVQPGLGRPLRDVEHLIGGNYGVSGPPLSRG